MQIDGEALAVVGTLIGALAGTAGVLWKRNVTLEAALRDESRDRLEFVEKLLEKQEAREREHLEFLERIDATQRIAIRGASESVYRGPLPSRPSGSPTRGGTR